MSCNTLWVLLAHDSKEQLVGRDINQSCVRIKYLTSGTALLHAPSLGAQLWSEGRHPISRALLHRQRLCHQSQTAPEGEAEGRAGLWGSVSCSVGAARGTAVFTSAHY